MLPESPLLMPTLESKVKLALLLPDLKLNTHSKLELLLIDSENSTTHTSTVGTKDQDIAEELTDLTSIPRTSEREVLALVLLDVLLNVKVMLNAMPSSSVTTTNATFGSTLISASKVKIPLMDAST